jgi:hypothetical protein
MKIDCCVLAVSARQRFSKVLASGMEKSLIAGNHVTESSF